jgi:hypothetical protein
MKCDKVLVRNPEGKRPPGRPRRRWKDNIDLDLKYTGWECEYWIHLHGFRLLPRGK